MRKLICSLFVASGTLTGLLAQNGDKTGEVQQARVPAEKIPPAPPLSPAEALGKFKIAPGFKIGTFVHEPAVQVPTVMQFDPAGRAWILEMRAFMPNPDGLHEDQPTGRISIHEDTDHDGVVDQSKVFLDGLVLPRALLLVYGGALVAEPPNLWFYPIQNDRPGDRVLVDGDYAREGDPRLGTRSNPEHSANSLTLALDNWIYSLDHTRRYRRVDGQWIREAMPKRSQWGLSQDDFGRLYYNSNSDHTRGDMVSSHYLLKAAPNTKLPGLSLQLQKDQSVWPIRVNPGVNRGYQSGTLREDGTLWKFTATCGTSIYRGDALPEDCRGNAFLGEPSANLVRRNLLSEKDGVVSATNAYAQAEFLASTDELFRPVNTYTGPDGALYIVDMYHGIIQHRVFLTSYLRQQAESRGLPSVTNYGRIYRVTHETTKPSPGLNLARATAAELVNALRHPNGWRRDTAQRLLIDLHDPSVVPALQSMALGDANPLARLQALWTLEGLKKLDAPLLEKVLADAHPKLQAAAARLSESFLRATSADAALRSRVLSLARDSAAEVQMQVALTLGEIAADDASKAALQELAASPVALVKDCANFSLTAREPKAAAPAKPKKNKLTAEELKLVETGKANYETFCLPCHQPHGLGQEGLAPPLAGSEWVAGPEGRLVRIVLNGLRGPIKVKGQTFELDMPALGVLEDEQIATVLSYVRNEWGHAYPTVSVATVKKIRELTAERSDAWTEEELNKIP